jgi:hypothetical protein
MTTAQRLDRLERALLAVAERALFDHNPEVSAIREDVAKREAQPTERTKRDR